MLKGNVLTNHWVSFFGFFYLLHMFKVHLRTNTYTHKHTLTRGHMRNEDEDEAALCLVELPTAVMCLACCRHTAGSCVCVKRSHAGWGWEPRSATPTRFLSVFHPPLELSLLACHQPGQGWWALAYCLTWSICSAAVDWLLVLPVEQVGPLPTLLSFFSAVLKCFSPLTWPLLDHWPSQQDWDWPCWRLEACSSTHIQLSSCSSPALTGQDRNDHREKKKVVLPNLR